MKKVIIFLLLSVCSTAVIAQRNASKAMQAMKQLMIAYSKNNGLSFDLQFTYAPESRPGEYLDSLQGKVTIYGSKSWYMIDSTESVNTGDYLVTVFREDKLLYLAKAPSSGLPTGTGLSGMNEAWFSTLDSLVENKLVQLDWKEDDNEQQINIRYPETREYKMLNYVIDRKTGLLKQSITLARADQLQGPESRRETKMMDEFAIITTSFTNYRKGGIKETLFDPSRYFVKKGNDYEGVNEFRDFQVFLGTPGM